MGDGFLKRRPHRLEIAGVVGRLLLEQRREIHVGMERRAPVSKVVDQHRAGVEQSNARRKRPLAEHRAEREIVRHRPEIETRCRRRAQHGREIGAERQTLAVGVPVDGMTAQRVGREEQPASLRIDQREAELTLEAPGESQIVLPVQLGEQRRNRIDSRRGGQFFSKRGLVVKNTVEHGERRAGGRTRLRIGRGTKPDAAEQPGSIRRLDRFG